MARLMDLSAPAFKEAISDGLPLFIATGTMEYHGSHLPLGTDLHIVEGVIREIGKRTHIVVAPPFSITPTGHAVSGLENGTIDSHVQSFVQYAGEILFSYILMGFRKIYVLTHHQSDSIGAYLRTAIDLYANPWNKSKLGEGWWTQRLQNPDSRLEIVRAVLDFDEFTGHAGKGETQAMFAFCPKLTDMERADPNEHFWTRDVLKADFNRAAILREVVINRWIEKLERDEVLKLKI